MTRLSLAIALASSVLPQPERTCQQIPLGGRSRRSRRGCSVTAQRPLHRLDQPFCLMSERRPHPPNGRRHLDETSRVGGRFHFAPRHPPKSSMRTSSLAGVVREMVACAKSMSGMMRAQTNHGRLAAQRFQIRTHKAVRDLGQMAHVDVPGQRHAPAVDGERLPRARGGREWGWQSRGRTAPAGAEPGRAGLGRLVAAITISLPPFGEPVHERQQLRHHPFFDFPHDVFPSARRNGVDLIQKNDAGALARGLLEDLPEMRFALARRTCE